MPVRGLDAILADLDARQRATPASKNRPVVKFAALNDTVGLSSDAVTTTTSSSAYQWAVASSTDVQLYWGEGEWR